MSEKDSSITLAERIIERLHQFNRKERDYLMKFALCEEPAAPRISKNLWDLISNEEYQPDPKQTFIGMDYHLNWLYAALANAAGTPEERSVNGSKRGPFPNEWKCPPPADLSDNGKNSYPIQGNQEDVDLLVAWIDPRSERPLRLVLIEAKLDSSWTSSQFEKKRKRLTLIKNDAEKSTLKDLIQWDFLLLSPGSAPSKGTFKHQARDDKHYGWLYKDSDGGRKLWHEELRAAGGTLRVKRASNSSREWAIEPTKLGNSS